MRKIIFLLLVALFPLQPLCGQLPEWGLTGGITVSQVDGDPYKGYYKAGGLAGIWTRMGIGHFTGIQAELRYIGKGSSDGNQVEGTNTFYRMNLHYLELPVVFQYYYRKKAAFELGAATGWLFSSSEKDEFGMMLDTDPFRKFELAGVAGVRVQLLDNLGLGIRFSYSILPVREHAGGGTWYLNRGQYNNLFAFALFYRFWPIR